MSRVLKQARVTAAADYLGTLARGVALVSARHGGHRSILQLCRGICPLANEVMAGGRQQEAIRRSATALTVGHRVVGTGGSSSCGGCISRCEGAYPATPLAVLKS